MAQSYDINEAPPDDETPSVEQETESAKLYLQKFCPAAGDNLYDHLTEVLKKLLSERPGDPFASFEEYSRRLRDDKYKAKGDYLRRVYKPPAQYRNAVKLIELFKENKPKAPIDDEDETLDDRSDESEDVDAGEPLPNMFELMFYFEQNGVGLTRSDLVIINLSIRKLVAVRKLKNVRFWGKILGRPKNYYILEANLSDSEFEKRLEELEQAENAESKESVGAEGGEKESTDKVNYEAALGTGLSELEGEEAEPEEDDTLKLVFPPIPENTWKPPPEVASEKFGTGANEKVYFVCNSPGLDNWVELPSVTPQQIVVARQIVYLFTGNLEHKIHSFPPFPGNEKNYLRAQIARISATTQISPIGYFKFGTAGQEDEDEEEEVDADDEEEEGAEGGIVKNRRYEPLPLKELTDPSMSNWCHHARYLLKQGRQKWLAPGKADGEGESDEEEEEEEEGEEEGGEEGDEEGAGKGFEKEIGPPLLTPLSEDAASEFLTPWTVRQSSTIQTDTAVAFVRSNVWPGAFAFASDKVLGNLYIGWGHKHQVYNYSPPALPEVQDQYLVGAELEEIRDPSFEEEEAYRIAHLPPLDDGEEYEAEEKSEEDDEDDED